MSQKRRKKGTHVFCDVSKSKSDYRWGAGAVLLDSVQQESLEAILIFPARILFDPITSYD